MPVGYNNTTTSSNMLKASLPALHQPEEEEESEQRSLPRVRPLMAF
jgi:hypothetical protein